MGSQITAGNIKVLQFTKYNCESFETALVCGNKIEYVKKKTITSAGDVNLPLNNLLWGNSACCSQPFFYVSVRLLLLVHCWRDKVPLLCPDLHGKREGMLYLQRQLCVLKRRKKKHGNVLKDNSSYQHYYSNQFVDIEYCLFFSQHTEVIVKCDVIVHYIQTGMQLSVVY